MEFLIIGERAEPPTTEDVLIQAKLLEFRFSPRWMPSAELSEDSAEGMLGIIISAQQGHTSAPQEQLLSFLNKSDVPLLALGEGAGMLLSAYTGTSDKPDTTGATKATINVDNSCILFDFLPPTVEVDNWKSTLPAALPDDFMATAHDQAGTVVAFQHNTREFFALDLSLEDALDTGVQVVENFIRYAGFFNGEL